MAAGKSRSVGGRQRPKKFLAAVGHFRLTAGETRRVTGITLIEAGPGFSIQSEGSGGLHCGQR
jgi:hypothetical protein